MLLCVGHSTIEGWLNRVVGWIDTKLDELARYAVDPSSGGGLQSVDYLVLQLLNRVSPVLLHFQHSRYIHPERLYEELLRLAGELATFATAERRARQYPLYDHDNLEMVFEPVVRDIQDFLSARLGRRAIRLEIIERAQMRSCHRSATVRCSAMRRLCWKSRHADRWWKFRTISPTCSSDRPQHQDERDRPRQPSGVPLVHLPTPPPHIRAITDHVYFYLDRKSQLWPEFSSAASIGMHFSGDWPELDLAALGDPGRPSMSDKDKPSNPFGRTDRTIIRPNPGGRLPSLPVPPQGNPLPRPSFTPVPGAAPARPTKCRRRRRNRTCLSPAVRPRNRRFRSRRVVRHRATPFSRVNPYAQAASTGAPEDWILSTSAPVPSLELPASPPLR